MPVWTLEVGRCLASLDSVLDYALSFDELENLYRGFPNDLSLHANRLHSSNGFGRT
jgi:hypothetical protein